MDDCLTEVPMDDLEELYEICVHPNKKEITVTAIDDDWKFYCKPQTGHVRYVAYCSVCINQLSMSWIKDDLDEICANELRRIHGFVDDSEL
jgi:hypothetical protein